MSLDCPACGHRELEIVLNAPVDHEYFVERAQPAIVMRCCACLSFFQNPWPSAEETATFYGSDYQNYTTTSAPFVSDLHRYYTQNTAKKFLTQYGSGSEILDFGCGHGAFLRSLADAGAKNLAGFEFDADEVDAKAQIPIRNDLQAFMRDGRQFDVIVMNHVIEHIATLDDTMCELAQLLKPDGVIVGETPNAQHYTSKIFGQYWGPMHFPYHLLVFSPSSLKSASVKWGLELDEVSSSIMPTGWSGSFENLYKKIFSKKIKGRTKVYALILGLSAPMAICDYLNPKSVSSIMKFRLSRALL